MAELSLPLRPELKKSLERYDVQPHDGKISSFEISKMPAEARAQLFENALKGSDSEKRVALALFKKMSDAQILATIDKFGSNTGASVCPATSFYFGALVDDDLPRIKAMHDQSTRKEWEKLPDHPNVVMFLQDKFRSCLLTDAQMQKLDPIVREWQHTITTQMNGGKPIKAATGK